MTGTFNDVPLRKITSLQTLTGPPGFARMSFQVIGREPELEQILQLNAPALLILSSQEVQGRIVKYTADLHHGYEITIESRET